MYAFGTEQTSRCSQPTSAYEGKADIARSPVKGIGVDLDQTEPAISPTFGGEILFNVHFFL
jgi:hypothetical protein